MRTVVRQEGSERDKLNVRETERKRKRVWGQVFNAASLGATRITKAKKEVFNNFSFSLYLLSHAS